MWYEYRQQVIMLNKINISSQKQILIVYIVLIVVTLAVFMQVNQFDFINVDDPIYVTENIHIQSGITLDGLLWAFNITDARYCWHPLTWLSLMFDFQLYGLNAGGYHVTNLILHSLSTLLLFWLFNRMTGAVWKSAFVAAFFALHPLRVQSVAFIAERKDVLSAFFWMLTLCLYVLYAEKPVIKRYLLVLFGFVCGLMSKPMVVTLPLVMILLDYWPLSRFRIGIETQKGNVILWQLKEKLSFFILSAVISIITLYAQHNTSLGYTPPSSLGSRIAYTPVSFVSYLERTFWPHDLAAFYSLSDQLPAWQVIGAVLLTFVISIAVIVAVKRLPYLFVGWLWYAITILPVIGIIRIANTGNRVMADYFTYLPSIGIAIMLVWGIPLLFPREDIRKKILFPAGIAYMAILAVLTWQQCGYWKNSIVLVNHTLQVTKDNYLAHFIRGSTYFFFGQYQPAIEDLSEAIRLRPDSAQGYNNRGAAYYYLGQYRSALEDYNNAIRLWPNFVDAYFNRGTFYYSLGQFQLAIEDFNKAISLKSDYGQAYNNRGVAYLEQGNNELGCRDMQTACKLGDCKSLEEAKRRANCR
jgi:hypothetical protein